jgi:hypothetical protein
VLARFACRFCKYLPGNPSQTMLPGCFQPDNTSAYFVGFELHQPCTAPSTPIDTRALSKPANKSCSKQRRWPNIHTMQHTIKSNHPATEPTIRHTFTATHRRSAAAATAASICCIPHSQLTKHTYTEGTQRQQARACFVGPTEMPHVFLRQKHRPQQSKQQVGRLC